MTGPFVLLTIEARDKPPLPVDRWVFRQGRRLHRQLAAGQAHVLPLDLDGDRRLEHALLWGPDLDEASLGALAQAAALGLVVSGQAEILRDRGLAAVLGPDQGSRRWCSATPYLAPRRTGRRMRAQESVEALLQEELAARGLPRAEVRILPERELSFRHFVLHEGDERPPEGFTHALSLVFETPVQGPLCLGYGQRFGLGRFEAEPGDIEPG